MMRLLLLAVLGLALTACGSDKDVKADAGKRISVLEATKKPVDHDPTLSKPTLAPQMLNKDWPQAGGNAEHALLHPSLGANEPTQVWSSDIGSGSSGDYRLLATPVISGGRVFTLDAEGTVAAFKAKDGDRIWKFDTTPENKDRNEIGGGLAVSGDSVYVTTGFGEVISLKVDDGAVMWRKSFVKPIRAAPTVADNRLFVVSIDNELQALDVKTGDVLWHHNGIAESATLMGSSNPAVAGDSVVVTYSSGEIFNLRAQNGRVGWTDQIGAAAQIGALPAIADIRGLPVIDRGRVFAISHSGRMAVIDQRTGDRAWEVDIGGTNTPLVSGDAVYVLSNDNELIALTRDTGRIIWTRQLQKLQDPDNKDSSALFWYGPVLAGDRLWLTNSMGHLWSFSPYDGKAKTDAEIADAFFIPPVVSNNKLYLLSDDGRLYALK